MDQRMEAGAPGPRAQKPAVTAKPDRDAQILPAPDASGLLITQMNPFRDALPRCLLWCHCGRTGQTRIHRLAILTWLLGYDRDTLPTAAALARSLNVSAQAVNAQIDDLKDWLTSTAEGEGTAQIDNSAIGS